MKLFSCFLAVFVFFLTATANADCFTDCMGVCWSSRSDENVSYCSATEARCETQCRHAKKSYGAIAYSKKEGAYGYSDNWEDEATAEKNALDGCKENGPGCEIVVWFYDSCAAVAGSGDIVSWGQDSREAAAKQKALDACAKEGGTKCNIKVSHCSK
jgi:hypothetical protein